MICRPTQNHNADRVARLGRHKGWKGVGSPPPGGSGAEPWDQNFFENSPLQIRKRERSTPGMGVLGEIRVSLSERHLGVTLRCSSISLQSFSLSGEATRIGWATIKGSFETSPTASCIWQFEWNSSFFLKRILDLVGFPSISFLWGYILRVLILYL